LSDADMLDVHAGRHDPAVPLAVAARTEPAAAAGRHSHPIHHWAHRGPHRLHVTRHAAH
jgi:hypothetical protein